jgi:hypothetical protein
MDETGSEEYYLTTVAFGLCGDTDVDQTEVIGMGSAHGHG